MFFSILLIMFCCVLTLFQGAAFFIKSLFIPLDLLCANPNMLAKAQTHHNKIIKRSLPSGSYYICRSQTRYCFDMWSLVSFL